MGGWDCIVCHVITQKCIHSFLLSIRVKEKNITLKLARCFSEFISSSHQVNENHNKNENLLT